MRKTAQIIPIAIALIVFQTSTLACTLFSADDGVMSLAGNNGDYSDSDTYIVFYQAENGKHGRMYAGWKQFWWQTGLNDQGLFYASASAPFLEAQNSTQKPYPSQYLMYTCMEECSTVEDVLNVFSQYNLDFLTTMQLMVADATGASVIIEGDPIHMKQHYYQVVTNFRLSQTYPPYPCQRYNTAVAMFENTSVISPDFFTSVCNATHNEIYTQFSTVYDLQKQTIYLFWQHNYSRVRIFNLTEELKLGYHIYAIPSLFTLSNAPTPPIITGTTSGKIGTEYEYTFVSTDPEGDAISYYIDWEDNSNSSWTRLKPSGEELHTSHSWSEKGTYIIKAKAKDSFGAESDWATLVISMPKVHTYNPILQFILKVSERFPFL